MDKYEKYFFDVNGYIVVEDILSAEQVQALNEAIDHNQDNIRIREGELRLSGGAGKHGGQASVALEGEHGRGVKTMSQGRTLGFHLWNFKSGSLIAQFSC